MTSRAIIAFILLILSTASLYAQRRHHVWYFGDRAGIDFNAHPPQPLTDSRMNAVEGCAVMCDSATGEILFYTNGDTVWDGKHRRMPNGVGLAGHVSATQSAVIVPAPGDSTRYYIFTVDAQENGGAQGLGYSVVDMTLNSGWGDVTTKNVFLLGPTAEKLCAVQHCNGKEYWAITHDPLTDAFYSVHITATGVDPVPVVSHIGAAHGGNGIDWMSASPDGRWLGVITRAAGAELFRFDPCTGIVSNAITLPPIIFGYGLAFSPDNTKFYIGENRDLEERIRLLQFDLASNDVATIAASGIPVFETASRGLGITALRLAPDGRIYVARCCRRSVLGVINRPNRRGTACDYRDSAFALDDRLYEFGLPNFIDNLPRIPYAEFSMSDSVICVGACVQFYDSSRNVPTRWRWVVPGNTSSLVMDQQMATFCFDSAGIYPVTLVVENGAGTDSATRYVTVRSSPRIVGPDTLRFCGDTSVKLSMSISGGSAPFRYSWSPSTALNADDIPQPVASPSIPIDYTLTVVDANGCRSVASVHVEPGVQLLVASSAITNGEMDIGEAFVGSRVCQNISIINQGLGMLVLNDMHLVANRSFSIPPSQLPFVLAPGEERELEVCYSPTGSDAEQDTLLIEPSCGLQLPLVARPSPFVFSGADVCGTGIGIGRIGIDGPALKVLPSRPAPATDEVRIEAELTMSAEHDVPLLCCQLRDLRGNIVETVNVSSRGQITGNGLVQEHILFTINVQHLPSGLYFADIQGVAETVAVPVLIRH